MEQRVCSSRLSFASTVWRTSSPTNLVPSTSKPVQTCFIHGPCTDVHRGFAVAAPCKGKLLGSSWPHRHAMRINKSYLIMIGGGGNCKLFRIIASAVMEVRSHRQLKIAAIVSGPAPASLEHCVRTRILKLQSLRPGRPSMKPLRS